VGHVGARRLAPACPPNAEVRLPDNETTLLDVGRRGKVPVARFHGRLTEIEAPRVEKELRGLMADDVPGVIVDINDVPFISSAGLGAFMVAYKEGKRRGGYFRLVGAQPLVRQVLETTKLTKLFGLYDSVQDALAAG